MLTAYRNLLHRAKIIALGVSLFVLLIFMGTFLAFLRTPFIANVPESQPVHLIFPMGKSVVYLANQLHTLHLLSYPREYFILLSTLMRADEHLHAGEYLINPGMRPIDLLQDMLAGKVLWRKFLFVEGWTLAKLRSALDDNPYLTHKTRNLTEAQLADLLHIKRKQLEGLFFPDTYLYTAGFSDTLILQRAAQAMQKHLQAAWQSREPHLIYQDPYQALIVASLVEKEAKLGVDRPRIAGVILKRLKIDMPLQVDATVIYGLGDQFDGKLKLRQLKIPGPYNSYLQKGLPPTPIAMPGEASLKAAMHPIIDQDLFYVARGDGGHVFSATWAGQNKAVQHYRAVENQHG